MQFSICGNGDSERLKMHRMLGMSFIYLFIFIIIIFLLVVNFVIHWNETAMGLHVFPIPIPPPTSLSTRSL